MEYKYKINNVKILAKSNVLEEQAYFEVNICDKEKADEFVKIFGKMNGSGFQPDKKAKRRQGFISSSFVIFRKGKELREKGKGKKLSSSDNYKLFKCTNKHQLEDEVPWLSGSLIIRIGMRGTIPAGQIEL